MNPGWRLSGRDAMTSRGCCSRIARLVRHGWPSIGGAARLKPSLQTASRAAGGSKPVGWPTATDSTDCCWPCCWRSGDVICLASRPCAPDRDAALNVPIGGIWASCAWDGAGCAICWIGTNSRHSPCAFTPDAGSAAGNIETVRERGKPARLPILNSYIPEIKQRTRAGHLDVGLLTDVHHDLAVLPLVAD